MTKEQIRDKFLRIPLRVLALLQLIAILGLISSPFIFIWVGFDLAWRTGLSSLVTLIACGAFYKLLKSLVDISLAEVLEERPELKKIITDEPELPSKFQQRMAEYQKGRSARA